MQEAYRLLHFLSGWVGPPGYRPDWGIPLPAKDLGPEGTSPTQEKTGVQRVPPQPKKGPGARDQWLPPLWTDRRM